MGMASEMKNLSEEILASYKQRAAEFQQRLKDNADVVKEVQKTLDGFRNDHMEMAATLRANAATLRSNLAQEQKDRIAGFQQLMDGIHASITQIQNEVEGIKTATVNMLKDFSVAHDAMATKLQNDLDLDNTNRQNWNTGRLKNFDAMMANINQEIAQIQKEVSDVFSYTDNLLKKFSTAHSDMSAAMRADLKANLNERVEYTKNLLLQFNNKLAQMSQENQDMAKALRLDLQNSREALSQSDIQRLNNFNVVFTGIQNRVQEIQKYVNNFIDEFSTDRKQAAATWEKLAEAIANIGKGSVAIDTEPIVDEPAGVTIAITTEPIVDEPVGSAKEVAAVVEEAPAAAEPQKELTLEEKVLNYLSGHKSGIKISDMEAPLGETRMRIGFITKKLLEEGKVQKVENLYYPLA
jgi:uncharacterized protein YoxC